MRLGRRRRVMSESGPSASTSAPHRSVEAGRLQTTIDLLSKAPFSSERGAVMRYAFTRPYMKVIEHLRGELGSAGFQVALDPIGNLVDRNRPRRIPFTHGSRLA
jgi:hypothetical protein